ncbi:hypothetical protein C8R46DRAFT_903664 [Mycena filopes]|nr:hypothetical protein C8R46DRAFT_903664 [Mycena filopes]
MPVPAWGDDWEDDYIYPEFEYHHYKPHHAKPPAWMSETPHPKHARFHWVDGNITVVVGSVEYKLHRYLFKNSTWFFAHGSPTYLPMFGFAQNDFDRFLTVLYPQDYSEHECKTAEEWTSVLNVAAAAGMQDIRRLAIKQLTPLASPIEKIALGHRYDVKEWLGPAYLALAMRKEPISGIEGAKIGVEALVRVAALKDEVFANLTAYVDQSKFAELFAAKMAL